jgi:hypothetical protein
MLGLHVVVGRASQKPVGLHAKGRILSVVRCSRSPAEAVFRTLGACTSPDPQFRSQSPLAVEPQAKRMVGG